MLRRLGRGVRDFPLRYRRIVASGTFVPQIDGLRFLAIIQVVFYHAALRGNRAMLPGAHVYDGAFAWFPNGAAGVELFFFISGYIIAYPFLAGRAPSLGAFFKRRLLRLEPPYILAVIGCFAMLMLTGYRPADSDAFAKSSAPLWQSFLASLVYMNGILFAAPPRLNPPLWSLELEIQFYILAPLLLALYQVMTHRVLRRAVGIAIFLGALLAQPLLTPSHQLNYLLISHFWGFWLGILFCDWAIEHKPFEAPAHRGFDLAGVLGLAMFLVSSAYFYQTSDYAPAVATLLLRAGGIVLIYLSAARGPIARRLFGAPWLVLIGGACYSIYLTHVPVLQIAAVPLFKLIHPHSLYAAWAIAIGVLVPIAVCVGMLYYLTVERFCMQRDWPQRLAGMIGWRSRTADEATASRR